MASKKIDGSMESLMNSIQEVFRDCSEQKRRSVTELKERKKRFEPQVEDFEQMKTLADANNGTLRVINDVIAKKLELIKIQARVVQAHGISPQVAENVKSPSTSNSSSFNPNNSNFVLDQPLTGDELSKLREVAASQEYEILDKDNEDNVYEIKD
jgi:hypothetical protein